MYKDHKHLVWHYLKTDSKRNSSFGYFPTEWRKNCEHNTTSTILIVFVINVGFYLASQCHILPFHVSQHFSFISSKTSWWERHQKDKMRKKMSDRDKEWYFNKFIIWAICFYFYFHLTVFLFMRFLCDGKRVYHS